jgi:iron complex outermembrane receptor protein
MNKANYPVLIALLPLALDSVAFADDAPQATSSSQNPSEKVVVTGTRENEQNYRVPTVDSIGPLGSTPVLDVPYSIGILPHDLIENSQAVNFKDVSKYLPLVAFQEQQGPDILRPQTRGMQGGNFQNSKQDGMTMFITVAEAMEQFEQIEVVNGLSASLYGPANPSGMFNFVTKRPTDYDLREVTASYVSDSVGTVKADLGGRIDPGGIVSYRVNALYGSGEGYVDMSHQRRVLGDIGIDVRPWEHGVLELNYSNYTLNDVGYPGWFTYNETIHLPPTPDPSRVGFGQPYAGTELRTQTSSARIKQDFGSDWHLVAGILNQDATRNINTAINNLTSNSGNYTTSFASGFAPRFVITSDTAYLNGTFDTLGIGHDFTFGTAGYRSSSYSVITPATAASLKLGTANVYDPVIFAEPAAGPPNVFLNYDSSDVYQQGFNINDLLKFTDQWSARFGASQDWFHTNNFNNKSVRTTQYVDHGVSPTGSIIFKPATNMTTYFTYASALQAGDLAPGTAKNSGEGLAPYRSKEYELGYKASLSGIDLTAALFRIERPFANLDPVSNIFGISGQQVNRGLELSAIGEVIDGLTLYGGVQLLNARLEHTPLATTNDKIYVGAPKVKGNMLFEYKIPGLAGLVATLDYQFSGTRAANDTNSYFAPGYNLFDLGARYTSNIWSKPVTWRLSVDNVTDRHYWSTIAPSNLTGANTGNLLAHFGSPRMLLASVSVNL